MARLRTAPIPAPPPTAAQIEAVPVSAPRTAAMIGAAIDDNLKAIADLEQRCRVAAQEVTDVSNRANGHRETIRKLRAELAEKLEGHAPR